jgi:hypothetical protein
MSSSSSRNSNSSGSTLHRPEAAPRQSDGHDNASLGPSDSSDSGSDRAGLAGNADSDAAGTGERPSVDASESDDHAGDIGVDHSFTPGRRRVESSAAGERLHDDEDPDLDFVDAAMAPDPLEDDDAPADGESALGGLQDEDDNIPGAVERYRPARPDPETDHP